jgi:hypothetical protein
VVAACAGLALTLAVACSGDSGQAAAPVARAPAAPSAEATAPASPTAAPPPPVPTATPIDIADLPIIDLHFHPDPAWGPGLPALLDRLGVRAAGNGASGPDEVAQAEAERSAGRIVAFGGGQELRGLVRRRGRAAFEAQHPDVERYLAELEDAISGGRLKGIGELHVNNWASNLPNAPQYRFPADSVVMQRLWRISEAQGVPLSVHMDAEPQSVAEMERLLASDRRGIWLWAHTGHYAQPELVRRLLSEHPNLYCELSYRLSVSASRTALAMDAGGSLREAWRRLLGDFPDRFVIGTDIGIASPALYAQHIALWRRVLEQLTPEAAAAVAFRNAERLLQNGR